MAVVVLRVVLAGSLPAPGGRRKTCGNVCRPAEDMNRVPGNGLERRAHPDLNQGPADLQSAALTTELCTHVDDVAATDSTKALPAATT
jgi:hypothetical protein